MVILQQGLYKEEFIMLHPLGESYFRDCDL